MIYELKNVLTSHTFKHYLQIFTNWEYWKWEQYVIVIIFLAVGKWLKRTPKFKHIQNTSFSIVLPLSIYILWDFRGKIFYNIYRVKEGKEGVDEHPCSRVSNVPDMKKKFQSFNLKIIAWLLPDQLRNCLSICNFLVCSIWQLTIGLKWNSLNWG